MRIVDLLSREKIALGATAQDKNGAIDLLVGLQAGSGCITDKEAYKKAILAREAQTSTAIEAGIAVPHAKSDCVLKPSPVSYTHLDVYKRQLQHHRPVQYQGGQPGALRPPEGQFFR